MYFYSVRFCMEQAFSVSGSGNGGYDLQYEKKTLVEMVFHFKLKHNDTAKVAMRKTAGFTLAVLVFEISQVFILTRYFSKMALG